MYLSRMYLNPRRRGTRFLTANPQALHAAVMSAFPPGAEVADKGRTLWRLDVGERLALYVVSPAKPSFSHLQEQAGWENEASWDIRDYGHVLDRLMRGQRYSFRLAANPVRTVTTESGKKIRAHHVTAEQQLAWLSDREEALGVRFLDVPGVEDDEKRVSISDRRVLRFRRGGRTVSVSRVQFDGVMEVVDVAALRGALTSGVGKAKGYGCGLVTLAPAPAT